MVEEVIHGLEKLHLSFTETEHEAALGRALAADLGSRAITVNSVAPGFIDTDMTKVLSEEHKSVLLAKIPLGRLGDPEEVAGVVSFLASNDDGYVSGATIHVNGGMYMA